MTRAERLVLVCDDEEVLRELITVALGPAYRVCATATADEALAAVAAERPDAIVLDLMIPGGGGLAVLRGLREASGGRTPPVVVVSAWADEEHRREAEDEGAEAFLAKPFDPVELEQTVAAMIRDRSGGAGAG